MYCSVCGVKNEEGHKYCSECGSRLPVMPPRPLSETEQAPPSQEQIADDLIALWRLYEHGDLDGAVDLAGRLIRSMPDSSSARSVLALIYEKRASLAEDVGDDDLRKRNLDLAAHQYERILEANPDSGADRAKLAAVHRRLIPRAHKAEEGIAEPDDLGNGAPTAWEKAVRTTRAAYKAVPQTMWLSLGVFLLLVVMAFAIAHGRRPSPGVYGNATAPYPQQTLVQPEATAQQPRPLTVYTFPAPAGSGNTQPNAPPRERTARALRTYPDTWQRPVEPLTLPGITVDRGDTTTEKPSGGRAPRIGVSVGSEGNGSGGTTSPDVRSTTGNEDTSEDGDTWLARAGEFRKQGQYSLAAAAVDRAIRLYEADMAARRNVDQATDGLRTAKALKGIVEKQIR